MNYKLYAYITVLVATGTAVGFYFGSGLYWYAGGLAFIFGIFVMIVKRKIDEMVT